MFAVIKTGGKQYKVSPGAIIEVEKLEGAEIGSTILLSEVILSNDGSATQVGAPVVEGVSVAAEVLNQKKGEKVIVFKKKKRHNYRRKNGHRQLLTVLKIAEIGKGLKAKAAPAKAEVTEAKATKAAPKATAKTAAAGEVKKTKAAPKTAEKKTTTKTTKAKKAE